MQDPYFAVKEEVEHSVTVVLKLHERWLELSSAGKKSDEFEWTSSELLSGLRSIEWDLQDLEDTVSIVEGNRQKFQLKESDVQERKYFIENTRKQIVKLRDEVQGHGTSGFSTKSSGPTLPTMAVIGKKRGYGKVGSGDAVEMITPAVEDIENGRATMSAGGCNSSDDIIGDDAIAPAADPSSPMRPMMLSSPAAPSSKGRHRKKKCCIAVILLLVILAVAFALASAAHISKDDSAASAKEKLSGLLHSHADTPAVSAATSHAAAPPLSGSSLAAAPPDASPPAASPPAASPTAALPTRRLKQLRTRRTPVQVRRARHPEYVHPCLGCVQHSLGDEQDEQTALDQPAAVRNACLSVGSPRSPLLALGAHRKIRPHSAAPCRCRARDQPT